jgi:metal-responsive CopG/Arc/MetJ family transcriptional regulator
MKTAISIPDPVFQAAEGLAKRLGISRSQLYSKAILEFTTSHRNQNVTDKLNEIYNSKTEFDKELSVMQARSIPKEEW